MRGILLVFAILLSSPVNAFAQDWMMNGMNMQPLSDYPYGSIAACEEVRSLKKKFDVNTIMVRKNLLLKTYDSPNLIDPKNDGADDREISEQFAQDKKLGVKSIFTMGIRLQTDLDTPGVLKDCAETWHPWHGSIDYAAPKDYDSFFYQYGQKLLNYADIAKKSGNVSVFSIGHELASLATTRPLKDPLPIRDYINLLDWNLRKNGKEASAYEKEQISHLMTFSDSLKEREDQAHPNATVPDNRTFMQKTHDFHMAIHNSVYKAAHLKDVDDPVADRADLVQWMNSGSTYDLPPHAKSYLLQLENTRRAYLEGMWEQLIDKVKAKFADVPQKNRPLLTFNGGASDDVGFLDKLDVISVSMYGSLGSVDPKDNTPIDDGKTSVEDLKKGWMRVIDHVQDPDPAHYDPLPAGLNQFMANHPGKKMIFSELGFNRRQHSAEDSYLWNGCETLEKTDGTKFTVPSLKRPISNTERDHAIRALQELIKEGKVPYLSGIAMWNAYTHPELDEYCVDCWYTKCHVAEAGPYDQAILNLFKSASNVTNSYSNGDPCLAMPKPVKKPAAKVASMGKDAPDAGVPYLPWQDGESPLDSLSKLKYEPAVPPQPDSEPETSVNESSQAQAP